MALIMRRAGLVLLALLLLALAFFAALTAFEYRPAEEEKTAVVPGNAAEPLPAGAALRVLSWNLGYGALGDNADFFMDGGRGVYTADESRVLRNLADIRETVKSLSPDLCLLQEVDTDSDRSRHIDEAAWFRAAFPGFSSAFAFNHRALFVPFPIPPVGRVNAGLLTLSRYAVEPEAARLSLPCPFAWPIRTAQMKRCLLLTRIPVSDGKELVLVNLHLEAYDSGEGKIAQTQKLVSVLREESEKGNYVIAGGDFNQFFTGEDQQTYAVRDGLWRPGILERERFGDGLSLFCDSGTPTCRSLDRPYAGADPDDFQYYAIDGFILSDNIGVLSVETRDAGFVASDHNPVLLTCRLRADGASIGPAQ